MFHTTLAQIKSFGPCLKPHGWKALIKKAKAQGIGPDTPIPYTRILEERGLDDTLWVLGEIGGEDEKKIIRLSAVASAFEAWKFMDENSRNLLRMTHLYINGEATEEEFDAAMAAMATRAAAWAAGATWAAVAARDAWTAAGAAGAAGAVWAAAGYAVFKRCKESLRAILNNYEKVYKE